MSTCSALAGLMLAVGVAVPAAAARATGAAASQLGSGPADHSNVGATHSPQLLSQLAAPTRMSALTGSGQTSAILAPAAAVAGDEQGVDVASFQHPSGAAIDWSQVAASGVGFAAVKATEGAYYKNPYALTDLAEAKAAGLAVVAYAFAIPNGGGSSSSPVTQADDLLAYLGSGGLAASDPVMLDIEYDPYASSDGTNQCYGLSQAAMVSWIAKFDAEVQAKTGQEPIIYTPRSWWLTCTGGSTAFGGVPLWVPDPNSTSSPLLPAGWATWSIWQYAMGTVNGISGNTDLDQANPSSLALLNPGARMQTNGDPAGLQLNVAVPPPGQSLTYTATGLPPGVSVSPSGLITGWLTRAGSYTAHVSVSGSGGAAGSASFSWSAGAAPNSGPTGPVHFREGRNECLNDAGNRTANGTPVNIEPCNGSAAQQWTAVQDRTLRIHGKCLSVSGSAKVNGSKTVLEPCAGYASQQWAVGSWAALINGTAGKCLAGSSTGQSGVQDWITSCTGKASQKWVEPAGHIRSQVAGLCVDDKTDATANGNPVVIYSCGSYYAQQWIAEPDGTVHLSGVSGKCLDVAKSGTASGTAVDLYSCNGSAGQQWRIVPDGAGSWLKNPHSGLCLADPSDTTVNSKQLVISACTASDPGVGWRIH